MAIVKLYECDLCQKRVQKEDVRRVGVRLIEDRPDNADWLLIGPCCHSQVIGVLMEKAADQRRITEHGE